jgi:uncharacterized repeat protein (TIGR01451 family)
MQRGTLTTLHSFNGSDGADSVAAVIQATDGNFYGTTVFGGRNGYGNVFKMDRAATLTTLHDFDGSYGGEPKAQLIQASDGGLYGTTSGEGAYGQGTAFRIDAAGTLTTLHSFNGSDGGMPQAALIQAADGSFYGTSPQGGPNGSGVVFRLAALADLQAGVLANLTTVKSGGTLTYSITVHNDGPGPAANVVVTDSLPEGVTLASIQRGLLACVAATRSTVTCQKEAMAYKEEDTINLTVTVHAAAGSTIRNTVSASSDRLDPNLHNNTTTLTTKVTASK